VKPGARIPAFIVAVLDRDGSFAYVGSIAESLTDAIEGARSERRRIDSYLTPGMSVHVCELRVIGPPEPFFAKLRRWVRAAFAFVAPTPKGIDREAARRSCSLFMDELDEDLASQDARVRVAGGAP
jgi:hypothetical protein